MHKLFSYSGNKSIFLEQINIVIKQSNKIEQYVEPFLGSGAIFLNIHDKYDQFVINDIDKWLIYIFSSVKNCSYKDMTDLKDSVYEKFGNVGSSKKAYYLYRDWFNENLNTIDKTELGLHVMFLYSACINSMARWGPNGFNQSFGNRFYMPSKFSFAHAKNRLEKTIIRNDNAFNIITEYDTSNSLMFLDPPYLYRGTSYHHISKKQYHDFMSFLSNSKCQWLYTDTDNQQLLNYRKLILREKIVSTSPLTKNAKDHKEVLFTNIKDSIKRVSFSDMFSKT